MTPLNSLLRKSYYSIQDIEILLEQLGLPAIVWNKANDNILTCNPEFIIFSGYARPDVSKIKLETLLPGMKNSASEKPGTFLLASNDLIEVNIRVTDLRSDDQLKLISFLQVKDKLDNPNTLPDLKENFKALDKLLKSPLENSLESALVSTLNAGGELTNASTLAIYKKIPGSEANLVLLQRTEDSGFLPRTLDLSEIQHLDIPIIWKFGNQTSSILHQKALAAQYSYVATSPISPENPMDSLLVIADDGQAPPKDMDSLLSLVANSVHACFNLHNMVNETRSELKQTNIQLDIIRQIKDQITDGIIFVDEDKHVIDINSSACYMLGFFELEVIHQPLEKVLVCDCGITEILDAIGDTTTVHEIGEMNIQRRNGKPTPAHIRVIPLATAVGGPAKAILLSDLSTIKEFEIRSKQLETQANIGEMIAVFAHEVRNPINNIRMGIENFSTFIDEPDAVEEEVDRLLSDVDRISDLMKSILSAYRTTEYKMEPLDLDGLIEHLFYRWQPRMKRYGVDWKFVKGKDPAITTGDKRSLEQVFTNIIQNGINAMQRTGGTITIRIVKDLEDKCVHVDIGDTGPGIPDDIMDKIFNLYFSTKEDGHGIGLAITKQIIDAHNGNIEVTSVPGGTVFRVSLPLETSY